MIIDPKRDLMLERTVDVPPALVWKAWTEPVHLMPWFCPLPFRTTECTIDLRPGGLFHTVMEGPGGERHVNDGCYLEVVPRERLVWTDALVEGYRPAPKGGLPFRFTGGILLEPAGEGTRYRAFALHADGDGRGAHAEMGFDAGWGKALEQLVEHVKRVAG